MGLSGLQRTHKFTPGEVGLDQFEAIKTRNMLGTNHLCLESGTFRLSELNDGIAPNLLGQRRFRPREETKLRAFDHREFMNFFVAVHFDVEQA